MQFQKHFKSASPISLLLAQIVTSVFGFAVYFLFATPVTMYIAYTGREDEILRTAVTIIGTVFAVMVGTASTPLLNLRFEKKRLSAKDTQHVKSAFHTDRLHSTFRMGAVRSR